jgi:hypothetical protein
MSNPRTTFPILGGLLVRSVPWSLAERARAKLEDFADGRRLEVVANRGGVTASHMLLALLGFDLADEPRLIATGLDPEISLGVLGGTGATGGPAPIEGATPAPRPMSMHYVNHAGRAAWRRVWPGAIWHGVSPYHQGPGWFLRATDADAGATRDFRLRDVTQIDAPALIEGPTARPRAVERREAKREARLAVRGAMMLEGICPSCGAEAGQVHKPGCAVTAARLTELEAQLGVAPPAEAQVYPEGVTQADHIARDMRSGYFPARSTVETFLAERARALPAAQPADGPPPPCPDCGAGEGEYHANGCPTMARRIAELGE